MDPTQYAQITQTLKNIRDEQQIMKSDQIVLKDALAQSNNDTKAEVAKVINQVTTVGTQVSDVVKATNSTSEQLQNLTTNLQTEIMALKTQVSKVETQLNDHAKLLQTADATHASQMSDLENRLKSGNDTIQAGMAAIEAEIQGNKNDLVALNNRITAVEATGGTVDPTAIMNTIKTTVDTSIKDTKIEAADKLTALETRIRDDLVKLHGMIPKEGSESWMGNSSSKPILEYKAILNLATLKSDKTEYREWSDKLKNAMLQIRPGPRVFLTEVEMPADAIGAKGL